MTSIDDLFRKPHLPSSAHKRKLDIPDPQQTYKSAKLSTTHSPNHNHHASVQDNHPDALSDDDLEAGPALPPDDDEEPPDDDEDGRFFGSGMTRSAADALDYLDTHDGDTADNGAGAAETIDLAWLRRQTAAFERKVTRNAEQRARFADAPEKFMASEAELDEEIKSWSLLCDHPELYGEFARGGGVGLLVGLVAHENTDVAIGVVEIVAELLDEDVEVEGKEWGLLVDTLLEAGLGELLMGNLGRLDEEVESDRDGVYHTLAIWERLAGQSDVAERIGQEKVLLWLCNRMAKAEQPVSQNKQYAAEVFQVLLQVSQTIRKRVITDLDGVDLLLRLAAAYRRRDPPKDSHEEEFVENIFDSLTCVLDEPEGKQKFIEAEGIELCQLMMKEGTKTIIQRALRVLDHAAGGSSPGTVEVCNRIVEAACLKPLFGIFGKKSGGEDVEHTLGIFAALLRYLPGESAPRIRTLAKFSEKDFDKVKHLIKVRSEYAIRMSSVQKEIQREQNLLTDDEIDDRADEWLSRRFDGGLFSLQIVNVILAWLIAEEPTLRSRIVEWLGPDERLDAIRASLQEQMDDLGTNDDQIDTREMLEALIGFVQ